MLGKNLSNNDKYLLNIIYRYGGYVRVKYLKYLYPDMSERTFLYKLDKLETSFCLKKRRFINNSKREPITYQITQAGCNICGNINSTYRRKRSPEYAYRALLKCIFFLEIHSSLGDYIVYNVNDRRSVFETTGFDTKYFPIKINHDKSNKDNVSIVQFEEYFIDFRNKEGKSIKYNGDILYSDDVKGVIITYIDQPHIEINKQIATLVNRYIHMINQYKKYNIGFSINFLVVVDNDNRYKMYNNYLRKFLLNAIYQDRISDKLLLLYITFYEKLSKKDNSFNIIYKDYEQQYKKGILRKKFVEHGRYYIITDKNKVTFITEQIKQKDIKYLSDEIFRIVKSNENDLENARKQIEELFRLVAYLEYNNEIYLGDINCKMMYDIKLYKTKINVY